MITEIIHFQFSINTVHNLPVISVIEKRNIFIAPEPSAPSTNRALNGGKYDKLRAKKYCTASVTLWNI
jgi:hypothetical protein